MAYEVVVASQGAFGLSPQVFDQSAETCRAQALAATPTWHWFSATQVGFGLAQVMGGLPPAIAQSILPRGQYKDGLYAGGAVVLVPSLTGNFGSLLQFLSGIFSYGVHSGMKLGATQGAYPNVSAEPGVYVHNFVPGADRSQLGYLHARKKLPSQVRAQSLGEEVADVRVTGATFTLPDTGLLTAQVGFAGITPSFDDAPAWAASYDAEKFAVVSHDSSFVSLEIDSAFVEVPCVGASITLDNGIVPGNQMRVIGSPYPYDLPAFGPRIAAIRAAVMVDTNEAAGYELYSWLLRNATLSSTDGWSAMPYSADIHLRVVSPFDVVAGVPYAFEFLTVAGNCTYGLGDPLPLRAGGGVLMTLDITPQEVAEPDVDSDATGGSTTTVIDTALGAAADEYIGWVVEIFESTDGLAPQGERRIVKSNDTTTLTIDTNYPFSAAVGAGDNFKLYPPPWILRLQNDVASYAWPVVA